MKKIRINFIVLLVSIAMIALLIIQLFQTAQLYDRKSTQFKNHVQTVLDRIAVHHEKAEDIRRYLQVMNKDFSGRYKDILKKEFQNLLAAQKSISIKDTSILENGEIKNYLIIQGKAYDTISGLTAEHRVLARDVRHLRELFNKETGAIPNSDSMSVSIQLDQRVMQQIFRKATFVNEMMVEAFRSNVYGDPSKRIDVEFLDSVIAHEITLENLPKDYEFVVADEKGKPISFDPKKQHIPVYYQVGMDTSGVLSTTLFPQNMFDEKLNLYLRFPAQNSFVLKEMGSMLIVNIGLVLLIVVAFSFMFNTILTQKKLSEMKNDFISNMTHEFKTPISTISLACEALNDKDMVKASFETSPFIKMIADENKRLEVLVERILQSAVIDRGELKLKTEKLNLNEIIHQICNNAQFRISGSKGEIKKHFPLEPVYINADRVHTTNIISNLIDNAIKYSKDAPKIDVTLRREHNKIHISIQDQGVGISKEHLSKIFDKLYRVPTGNLHNVKGFGLGLSYVKAIVNLNNWNILVKSKPNEGSTFTLVIPQA
ncbi:MAG: hypothetical protein K0R65_1905 [Crocinitomicaceae bacterium]|nr:hypothetical protein [Crocinitomicaceae bacterium]